MHLRQRNFGYSMKNIPIANNINYQKKMMEKTESFVRRLRWSALAYDMQHSDSDTRNYSGENYGFKTTCVPPKNEFLTGFENDIYSLVKSIEFRKKDNEFLSKMKNDIKEVVESDKVFIFADKTSNLYELDAKSYEKVLCDNISKGYKKSKDDIASKIDQEAKTIVNDLDLGNRVDSFAKRNAFITLKDHKENFQNKLPCRLINPARSEIGKISRQILQHHNSIVRKKIGVQQWRDTSAVVDWFKNIENKNECTFLKFDIVDFYPSITKKTLMDSLTFAKKFTAITPKEVDIVLHARKSILFNKDDTWTKKGNSSLFDVTMGSYDSSEIAELVGLLLLYELEERFGKGKIGLYRDDGLGLLPPVGPATERARKDLFKIFNRRDFKITASTNLLVTDFLDVTFNLTQSKYYPYRKDNSSILYIDAKSNHPPSIIKEIPSMVSKRLSSLSCNENEFDLAKPDYEEALKRSGFSGGLKYTIHPKKKRPRKRKIIWYNPPYNANVKTKIGQRFLAMIRKHFPHNHKYYSIFNKNTLKLSYSCMENVETIIKRHNAKVLKSENIPDFDDKCNCRNDCPMPGNCRAKCIVYKAEVTSENSDKKVYYGSCEPEFKIRYRNHKKSFLHERYKNDTELSKYLWTLKQQNKQYQIAWSVHDRAPSYQCGSYKCMLCTSEKLAIVLDEDPSRVLNNRSDLVKWCPHRKKHHL